MTMSSVIMCYVIKLIFHHNEQNFQHNKHAPTSIWSPQNVEEYVPNRTGQEML